MVSASLVAFDSASHRIRIHQDANNNGTIEAGEVNSFTPLADGVIFGSQLSDLARRNPGFRLHLRLTAQRHVEWSDRVQTRGLYSTTGFTPTADLMVWWIGEKAGDIQDLLVAFRRTQLGRCLEPEEAFVGITMPAHGNSSQVETNLFGPLNVTRAVLPVLRAQRAGHVVTISSTAGLIGQEFCTAYATAKFGVEGWIESLTPEVAPFGIQEEVAPSQTDESGKILAFVDRPTRRVLVAWRSCSACRATPSPVS